MAPHDSDLYVGRDLDQRWRIGSLLGEGNFSFVMQGTDLTNNAPVAVKILRVERAAEAEEEFLGEIEFLRALDGCDRVVDHKGDGRDIILADVKLPGGGTMAVPLGVRYVVLEKADDCLANLLVGIDQVSWPERIGLFRDVVKGVHQMHRKRIVSRDLKSDNVLLFVNGVVTTAKVADLGRGRRTSDVPRRHPDEYAIGRGDFRFAPPEVFWLQAVDDLDHWAAVDLFHLGSVLYELVMGHGITAVVLPHGRAILNATAGLPPAQRKAEYEANIAPLRAQMALAWEPFETAVPKIIRAQTGALLRQLTDPDPHRRAPRSLGRPIAHGPGLEWLLRRTDIIQKTLHNAMSQAARHARGKTTKNGAA
jgi:serine/threonine protein kinase